MKEIIIFYKDDNELLAITSYLEHNKQIGLFSKGIRMYPDGMKYAVITVRDEQTAFNAGWQLSRIMLDCKIKK